jgi:asparagine synthase (glutamine-hydrolysing)
MSQVVGIAGADPEARAAFIAVAGKQAPLLSTQKTTHWSSGETNLLCASAAQAPLSSSDSAFVLGRLTVGMKFDDGADIARGGGYGVGIYVDPQQVTWLGADTLGLFPVYYHADADQLLFSTSPALIAADPAFNREFNARGLVGNLLTMHMVGGQTLWKSVRRLSPGHALRWKRGEGASEIAVNVLMPADAYFGESYEKHVERVDAVLLDAAQRESTGAGTGMLLSGGLDSRMLTAYLRRAVKSPVHCVTCGAPDDLEMRIAARVARHLQWPQYAANPDFTRFASIAEKHLTHMQLGNGLNDMSFWFAAETAAPHATSLFSGVLGDTVLGGDHIPWGFDPKLQIHNFETLFARINRYGFSPEQIKRLVRPEVLDGHLDAAMEDMRETYDRCSGLPFQKVWLWDLYHRNRFHIASLTWEAAAGAWPVLAFTGSEMLQTCANLPANSMLGRRIQTDLLLRHAPDLAALPLDHNSRTNLSPLKYRSKWQRRWDKKVMGRYRRWLRNYHDRRGIETRFYFRVYDINNAGWKQIREAAEPYRKKAEEFFEPDALRGILPPPNEQINVPDKIIDAAKIKTVLGFMLWAGKNL